MIEGQELPPHSKLGASSAERWLNCPGSVQLINHFPPPDEMEEPDYRKDGTDAHALAAHCLLSGEDCWQAMADYTEVTAEMAGAVQQYLDYVRSLPGEMTVEEKLHRPDFHPMAFGTLDAAANDPSGLEIVDYKHGVGVVVEVFENPQAMYYAYLKLGENSTLYPDGLPVKLTIVQPRALWHRDGVIRSWVTTAGAIRKWANEVLLPGMERATREAVFDAGSWCRFCPVKLACPKMRGIADDAIAEMADTPLVMGRWSDAELGEWGAKVPVLKMFIKAVDDERLRRLLAGADIPNSKLVHKIVDRIWKTDAPLAETFSEEAWAPQKFRSPAEIEKLAGGKEFVTEWAMKPEAGLTLANADDRRSAVRVQTTEQKFAVGLDKLRNA